MKMQTILAAVDGSVHADSALDLAADLAQQLDALLIILYVGVPIFAGQARDELGELARMEHNEQTEYEMLQNAGRHFVSAAEQRARKRGAQRIEPLVEIGDPAKRIVDVASARQAGLIVLGRRGIGAIAQLLLGSVSYKVVQTSKCPVVIVP
jgi:nucleotide-binding universal stress UspA family protein